MKQRCSKCGRFMKNEHVCKPHPCIGRKMSKEHREKISKANKGHIAWNRGIPHSEEIRKRISEANKGRLPWNKGKHPECFQGKNHPMYGRHHSKETKKKIGLGSKGRKQSMDWKIKRRLYNRGSESIKWNGGKKITDGYIFLYNSNHPYAIKRYVKQSRLVMEKILGRYLTPEEVMHHKGVHFPLGSIENKQDDSPENLQLFPNQSKHMSLHNKLRKQI